MADENINKFRQFKDTANALGSNETPVAPQSDEQLRQKFLSAVANSKVSGIMGGRTAPEAPPAPDAPKSTITKKMKEPKYSKDISALRERTFGAEEPPEFIPTELTSQSAKNVAFLEGARDERKNTEPTRLDAPLYQPNPESPYRQKDTSPWIGKDGTEQTGPTSQIDNSAWTDNPETNPKYKGYMNIVSAGLSPDDYTGYVMAANQEEGGNEAQRQKAVKVLESEMGFVPTEREFMGLLDMHDQLQSKGLLKKAVDDFHNFQKDKEQE